MPTQLKPKLPRKRKKNCIKCAGRQQYNNTIELARVTGESPCKFWKTVTDMPWMIGDAPVMLPTPTSFW